MNPSPEWMRIVSQVSLLNRIDMVCDSFEEACQAGSEPAINDFLGDTAGDERALLLRELREIETCFRNEQGTFPGFPESTRYVCQRVLGRGAFGRVYLAFDNQLQRQVAIKVSNKMPSPGVVERWKHETRRIAELNHPGIAAIQDIQQLGQTWCLISNYIAGDDLSVALRSRTYSPPQAARLVSEIARAVGAAHDIGLIHRNLKPRNIIVDANERPRILDFGLAGHPDNPLDNCSFIGTRDYKSPEEIEGHTPIDELSDIYSLGVILYELLTGCRPFQRDLATFEREEHSKNVVAPHHLNREIPPAIELVCLNAMSHVRECRYRSATHFAAALEAAIGQQSTGPVRRRWWGMFLLILCQLLISPLVIVVLVSSIVVG